MTKASKSLILTKLKPILAKQLDVGINKIKLNSHLIDDFGADSLAITGLALDLEPAFSVTIMDGDMLQIETVQQLVDLLHAKSVAA